MAGINKYTEKDRRKQRRSNHIARDLMTPKYHQRVVQQKKRVENDDGSFYLDFRYGDEDDDDY